jgi:formate hydrogenlyase transcriptional activator
MMVSKKIFNKLGKTVLIILLLSIGSTMAWGEVPRVVLTPQEQTWLEAHPDIKLGYTDAYEPEVIVDSEGQYRGLLVDILDELNKRLGTLVKLEIDTVKNIVGKAVRKEIDGILSLHPEYADKLGLLKTKGYISGYPAVFSNQTVSFEHPDDFVGKRVAIIDKAYFSEKIIQPYEHDVTILRVTDALEGLQLVNKGQADVFIGATLNNYLISKYQLFGIVSKYVFIDYPDKFAIAVRSDWPELVTIFNKGISSFSEKEIADIVQKWMQPPSLENSIELTSAEKVWIEKDQEVRVRLVQYPPYLFSKDDKNVGITVDLLNEVTEKTGIKFRFDTDSPPFKLALRGIIQHEGPDLFIALTPNPEREKVILFTKPYASTPRFIFTRDDAVFISGVHNLSGRTVAVIKGFLVHKKLAEEYPEVKLLFAKNNEDALRLVSSGKAFAFIGSLLSTPVMINEYGLKNLKAAAPFPMPNATAAMGIRNDWPELRDIINKVFEAMPVSKKTAIMNKWSSVKIEHGIRPGDVIKWVLLVAGAGLSLILIFVFWNRSLVKIVQTRTFDLEKSNKMLNNEVIDRKQAEQRLQETYLEIKDLKEQIEAENAYLRDEIQTEHNFSEIVGNSEGLRYVLFKVEQVAPTDSTVLILGETGTGKELVARAIHSTSPRSARPLIKVNCAALPVHLIESELFGHEKGAFTGATEKRMGRFELANDGTLFLDEIGELPLELQAKLLMVLQDGVFERVGSSHSIKVDVRLIAATNRDLEAEIQNGHFRQDLFYRLNVYSLTIPPLRERKEDIPILVEAFMNEYGKKIGKQVDRITQKMMDALIAHSWPGNIRELQNIIEKAVIMAQNNTLRVELPNSQILDPRDKNFKSLEEMERDYIQEILQLKNWRIDGPEGAAILLDLKPSTLRFRMKKLGIKRPS